MLSRIFFIGLVSSFLSLIPSLETSSFENIQEFPNNWSSSHLAHMSLDELQITTHFLYLLYANAVLHEQLRLFPTAISKLSQQIRIGIETYHNPAQEIATLKILTERLSYIMSAQALYTGMLNRFEEDYNQNEIEKINTALMDIQSYAQEILRIWAQYNDNKMVEQLQKSSQTVLENIKHFQGISHLHEMLSKNNLPIEIDADNEKNRLLIARGIIMNNTAEVLQVIDLLTNILNETRDKASQMVIVGTRIYKEFYSLAYNAMKEREIINLDQKEFIEQYKASLPEPDHMLEHVLEATKIYMQANQNLNQKDTHA